MKPKSAKNNYELILLEATRLAEKIGRERINFELISAEMSISRTILYGHFPTTESLKEEILKNALLTDNIIILIEALIFEKITLQCISKVAHKKIIDFFSEKRK